jgi:hypothetical protein
MTEPRRPFTCLPCYQTTGRNVDLVSLPITYNNLSVEAMVTYQCPECKTGVRFGL